MDTMAVLDVRVGTKSFLVACPVTAQKLTDVFLLSPQSPEENWRPTL